MNKYYTVKIIQETFNWNTETKNSYQIEERNFAIKEDAENFGEKCEKKSYKPDVSIDIDYSYILEENQSNKVFFRLNYFYYRKNNFSEKYETISKIKYFQSNQDLNSFINKNKESLKGFRIDYIEVLFFE